MKNNAPLRRRIDGTARPASPAYAKGLKSAARPQNSDGSRKIRSGARKNCSGPRPAPNPSIHDRATLASNGVPDAPARNGATGLPNRQMFRPYHNPPVATEPAATIDAARKERGR